MKDTVQKIPSVLAVLAIVLGLFGTVMPAYAGENTFYSNKDNCIYEGNPTVNWGSETDMAIGAATGGDIARSLAEFAVDWGIDVPDGALITDAELQLYYCYNYYPENNPVGRTVLIRRMLRPDWSESQSTWNIYKTGSSWGAPGCDSSATDYTSTDQASDTVPSSYGWMEWDVTAQVQWAQSNDENVIVRISDSTSTAGYYYSFSTKEAASNKPKLVITYVLPPTVTTSACTDAGVTSFTANGEVTDADGLDIIRRGFTYMEGEAGDPADVIEVLNPSFESGDPPDDWAYTGSATKWREGTKIAPNMGTYSLGLQNADGVEAVASQYDTETPSWWGDKTFTLGTWVWCDTSDRAHISMYDYVEGWQGTHSSYHPGDSQWHFLTVTRTMRSNPTNILYARMRITGGTPVTAYFDGAVLVEDDELLAAYEDGSFSEGEYDLEITGLESGTSYRVRAFAQSEAGIGHGNSVTGETIGAPSITTLDASNVASTSARLNSSLDDDGGEGCTIKFGWGLSSEPTIEDYDSYQTLAGTYTTGQYPYLDISGLLSGYTYYFRVSATNAANTTLGAELEFETVSSLSAPTNFVGYPESTSISLSWSKGTGSTNTLVRYGTSAYPGNVTAGTYVYSGPSSTYTVEGLIPGTTYYISAWGESGGNYSASYATLLMTTSGSTDDVEGIDVPTAPSRWFSTDYTNMSGLGLIYDGYNGALDAGNIPRATGWFLAAVGIAALFGLVVYLKFGKKFLIGMIAMTVVLAFMYFLKQVPWWLPLMTLILVIVWSRTHKQVQEG